MERFNTMALGAAFALLGATAGCSASDQGSPVAATAAVAPAAASGKNTAAAADAGDAGPAIAAALPVVLVHKTPTCGCCGAWVEHMRAAGFPVQVEERADLEPVRQRLGVPYGKGSCHTAQVGGYFVEGHVPADDVKRLLAERPRARGLVVPGMPLGSPGMETPDGRVQPYTVERVEPDGTTTAYARHGQGAAP